MSQLTAPMLSIDGANGTSYAYRRFGDDSGTPLIFLQCFRENICGIPCWSTGSPHTAR